MKYLLHMDDEDVSIKLNHNTYIIPPGKAARIDNDYHADRILEHKAYQGVVTVTQIPTDDGGMRLDIAEAKARAKAALEAADQECAEQYMNTQLEDRIRINYPALPPRGRALKVINRRNVDIFSAGIRPPGYEVDKQRKTEADDNTALRARVEASEAVNRELQTKLDLILEQMAGLTGGGQPNTAA